MRQEYEIIPVFLWIGIGAFIMVESYGLELGSFKRPGAGLLPFLLGILLICLAIVIWVQSLRIEGGKAELLKGGGLDRTKILKVGYTMALLFSYVVLLEKLGYILTTFFLLIFLFKAVASLNWKFCLLSSVLTVLGTYGAFTLLGVSFPRGIF